MRHDDLLWRDIYSIRALARSFTQKKGKRIVNQPRFIQSGRHPRFTTLPLHSVSNEQNERFRGLSIYKRFINAIRDCQFGCSYGKAAPHQGLCAGCNRCGEMSKPLRGRLTPCPDNYSGKRMLARTPITVVQKSWTCKDC